MNISHFFELLLCLIVFALTRHFEGHMKISAATLYKELSWKSLSAQHQQWHRHCKNFIFLLQIFLGKNRTSISDAPQYYFFCLFFLYQYHFDTITHVSTFPTHPFKDIYWCSRQMDVRIFGSIRPLAFRKK